MPLQVAALDAVEILDSHARPTLAVTVTLADGTSARAGVPSGASTGSREADELRDGDSGRFSGQGVRIAVANVTGEIARLLVGRSFADLAELDQRGDRPRRDRDEVPSGRQRHRRRVDGRGPGRCAGRRGAPLACARPEGVAPRLPVPHFNVVNGGVARRQQPRLPGVHDRARGRAHARRGRRAGAEVYAALRGLLADKGFATGSATRAASRRRSTGPRTSSPCSSRPSRRPATRPAARASPSPSTPPPASSTATAATTSPGKPLSSDEMIDRYEEIVARLPRLEHRGRARRGGLGRLDSG